ncbi:DNA topoisomerase IB [Nakamurella silvestris]|nr:DNA topoisomerase IB [Nakamurella silvestris]
MPRLRRSTPAKPGITRRRAGKGWTYLDPDGSRVTAAEKARIDALVIPPAWREVWICPWPNGHLQAIGTDAAGRRQYQYHDDWQAQRHHEKYRRVVTFGSRLPKARERVDTDLSGADLSRERVLATAFRLLDVGHFRIGGEVYAETNGSFGLATIRRDQVRREKSDLVFDYTAKSGLHRIERIHDEILLEVVAPLRARRGGPAELLAYREGRSWHRITGEDINTYLKEVTGLEVSAKDFRTWHGTVLAAVALAQEFAGHDPEKVWSQRAKAKAVRQAVVAVSDQLGNTPAVCRTSYINPAVVDAFEEGATITSAVLRAERLLPADAPDPLHMLSLQPTVERAVLKLLRS